jgi:hypothetical protein
MIAFIPSDDQGKFCQNLNFFIRHYRMFIVVVVVVINGQVRIGVIGI